MPHKRDKYDFLDDDGLVDTRPLTPVERKAVRLMIEREARIQWFWGTIRVWAGWISGAIIGGWAIIEIVRKILVKD